MTTLQKREGERERERSSAGSSLTSFSHSDGSWVEFEVNTAAGSFGLVFHQALDRSHPYISACLLSTGRNAKQGRMSETKMERKRRGG